MRKPIARKVSRTDMKKEFLDVKRKIAPEGRVSKFKLSHSLCRAGVNYIP